jgi:hypothetical protein
MQAQKLPHGPLERLRTDSDWLFADEAYWNAHLTRLGITQERHRRIATEGTLLGRVNEIFATPSRNARSVAGPEVTWGDAVEIPS